MLEQNLRKMMYFLSNGTKSYEELLCKKFTREAFELALQLHYICKCGCNTAEEQLYTITEIGRSFRDNRYER